MSFDRLLCIQNDSKVRVGYTPSPGGRCEEVSSNVARSLDTYQLDNSLGFLDPSLFQTFSVSYYSLLPARALAVKSCSIPKQAAQQECLAAGREVLQLLGAGHFDEASEKALSFTENSHFSFEEKIRFVSQFGDYFITHRRERLDVAVSFFKLLCQRHPQNLTLKIDYALVLSAAGDKKESRRVLIAALRENPHQKTLHQRLEDLESSAPLFDIDQGHYFSFEHEKKVRVLYQKANQAYAAREYERALGLAMEILFSAKGGAYYAAPRAHILAVAAIERLEEAEYRIKNKGKMMLDPILEDPEQRAVLIHAFEEKCQQGFKREGAQTKTAVASDFIPQWNGLNEYRKASIAYQLLAAYGKLLPFLINSGAQFEVIAVATRAKDHLNTISTVADPYPVQWLTSSTDNRTSIKIRGITKPSHNWGLTAILGEELVDQNAFRGSRDVGHEFGHPVHFWIMQLAAWNWLGVQVSRIEGDPSTVLFPPKAFVDKLLEFRRQIEALYEEAEQKLNGQEFPDGYSGTNSLEYFAMGIQYYLGSPSDRALLRYKNSHLYEAIESFVKEFGDLPKGVQNSLQTVGKPPFAVQCTEAIPSLENICAVN